MSELTHEDVREILDLIDRSQSDYFQLQMGDLKVLISKTAPPGAAPATPGQPVAAALRFSAPVAAPAPAPTQPATPSAPAANADRTGLIGVRAPMVGTFYAQSEPGAPPFVELGAPVDQDATLGLIEVMKVYTAIRAAATGTLAEILVANAQFVEFGQVLFYIRPSASA